MASPIYWLPNVDHCSKTEHIPPKCNLERTLDGPFSSVFLPSGPDGRHGSMLFIDPAPHSGGKQAQILFDANLQTWRPVDDEKGDITHWIGWEIAHPPRACDLIRPQVSSGDQIELAGDLWEIPLIDVDDSLLTTLPLEQVWKRGGIALKVADSYADLCKRGKKQFDWFRAANGMDGLNLEDHLMAQFEQVYFAADVLNVNYRVGPPEVCHFGLLKTPNAVLSVIKFAIGMGLFEREESLKKGAKVITLTDSWPTSSG